MSETYNPWTVVNLVFHHLAAEGLHPVLGETGDPATPAAALLRALGIEPGRDDEGPAAPSVQAELAELRARMFPGQDRE
ncbi:hypothetical protein H7X46_18925 [Pseudonocardia sp. C8]|uniref:hypothetical protein n=1 Tax=Pseudonocardia sp. C8 TaxID=2762759 RepID=UPI0016423A1F|nr:hypothetical protein [Pseudonocardia sp. C8]